MAILFGTFQTYDLYRGLYTIFKPIYIYNLLESFMGPKFLLIVVPR